MALVLSLCILLGVTSMATALLAIATLEPQTSRNLADAARARGLAEAGVETAYGRLGGPDAALQGAILAAADAPDPWVTLIQATGASSVRVRSTPAGGDPEGSVALIVRATGEAGRARVVIEATLSGSPDRVRLFNQREVP
jgi:hypothetical protein